ncbi:glyceraldehyde-3-phosphate dehydrogenase [Corynebacterium caspium]|uniref:glyceraldehyde-3-phosphate dehydrogenase n=1 Tax=Corynebacterium caspium TaxID=234828 RepID=UPI0003AA4CB2|nr:glyceraldehyde-3-phosphate dehydrogenase [Corynebacterium caspium]WKD59588.1 Glyceraldehyde-3-phosphate dehydrogenase [Corynebacterium caspium DSM 44850]
MTDHHKDWNHRITLAHEIVPLIDSLHRNHNVVVSIFGHLLTNSTPTDVIKAHRYARHITSKELPIDESLQIIRELNSLELGTSSIDIGQLTYRYSKIGGDLLAFLTAELAPVLKTATEKPQQTDVVLYGFGRIGRLLARILIDREALYQGVRLRAVVVRKNSPDDLAKRASLLRRDSVHGAFNGTISVDEENNIIWANGTPIQVIYSDDPRTVDYPSYGINNAVLVDNTGRWRDQEGLSQHLEAPGIARVLLTAPGKGDIKNIVYGINHKEIQPADTILSAASCTTNAITPVLKVINDRYGVIHGHVETIHSYTNDQNLIDNFHKGARRGRAAGLNMVLTETGAARAVAKALPELAGKLTGNAIRVPTPNVSMAVLNLRLEKETTKEEINEFLRRVSLHSKLRQQIDWIYSPEVVSTDFVGHDRTGIIDGLATIAEGKNLVLYVWYDNEFGYSNQVIRIVEEIAGARPLVLPKRQDPSQL